MNSEIWVRVAGIITCHLKILREDNTLSSFLDFNTEELRPSLKFQGPQRGIKPRVYHLWV